MCSADAAGRRRPPPRIQPPLVITDAELDRAIETLDRALTEVVRQVDDGPVREPANVAASAG